MSKPSSLYGALILSSLFVAAHEAVAHNTTISFVVFPTTPTQLRL